MPRERPPRRREPEIPSSTVSYFFREALRRIWISKRTSFLAISMITISLLVVGTFLLLAENLTRAAAGFQGSSRVVVYLDSDVTPEQISEVDRLLAAQADLSRRRLVSREEALERFQSWFSNMSDVLGHLGENPFPPSFEVEVSRDAAQSRDFHQAMAVLRATEGVDQVQHDWEWVTRLRRVAGVVNGIGIVAGGILAVAAAFTIANVIRLTMLLYREEIEIMRLVGATERLIRGPFLIEGVIQGTIGGLLAVAILFGAYEVARTSLAPSSSMLWGFLFTGFLPWQKIAAIIGGGMLAGWFGSWLSVRGGTDAE